MASKPKAGITTPSYSARLIGAVDSVPETHGMGVRLIDDNRMSVLRASPPMQPFVVIQLRPPRAAAPGPVAGPKPVEEVSVGKEWLNLGLNLGGATLSWIGVAGSVAAAPETGGVSLAGTVLLYGGATASSVQVGNSVWRLWAIYHGHSRWVSQADHNAVYTRVNTGLDVVGLVGAGGAVKETVGTVRALDEAGLGIRDGLGALNRQQRLRLTGALELEGAKRVAAARINFILRLRLLNAFAAAYGTGASSYNGAVHDVVVFIVHPSGGDK